MRRPLVLAQKGDEGAVYWVEIKRKAREIRKGHSQVGSRRARPRLEPIILHTILVVLVELDGENQVVQRRRLIIADDNADGDSRAARDSDL